MVNCLWPPERTRKCLVELCVFLASESERTTLQIRLNTMTTTVSNMEITSKGGTVLHQTDVNATITITTDPTTEDTFMQEVKSLLTWKIAENITKYWFPILVPIGLIGNTLSFLVMIKPRNRKLSTCIYMAAISVNDNLMMILALHNWLVTVVGIHEMYPIECRLAAFAVMYALQSSTFQVLVMTMDKYVAIRWPHKAATYSTPRRAKITIVCVFICAVIFNIPHVYISRTEGKQCIGYAVGGVITKIYSWLTIIVNAVIPFTLLFHMNYVIIQKVKSSHQAFGNQTQNVFGEVNQTSRSSDTKDQGRSGQEGPKSQRSKNKQKAMKSVESQLTVMLLLVTTLFLILMIPTYIRFMFTTFASRDTPRKYADMQLFYHVTHKLYHTNNGINFFLYCISGRKFRADIRDLLGCGVKDANATAQRSTSTFSNVSVISSSQDFEIN